MIRILYFFAILVIVIGLAMLLAHQDASPRFNNPGGSLTPTLNGYQVIGIGVIMLLTGTYIQRRQEKDQDDDFNG